MAQPPEGKGNSPVSAALAAPAVVPPIPKIDIAVFCQSDEVAEAIRAASHDRRMARSHVSINRGTINDAAAAYRETPSPNLVVVESDAEEAQLLAELDALAQECVTGTKVIVIGRSNDVDLYRDLMEAGVSDYLVTPFKPMGFVTAVSRCFRSAPDEKLGRVIAFIGAKGGVGSSTIAHNVAAAMADASEGDVLVADLDLQFGTLGLDFDVETNQGMADVLESAERVDAVLLERLAVRKSDHLHLLPVASAFDRSFDLKEEDVERLLDLARSNAWTLVLDMPHLWNKWTKQTLLGADEVVITAQPDLANMRNAKNLIESIKRARPNDPPPRLVLNKVDTPKLPEIKPKDFAEGVNAEISVTIPFDAKLFGKAANDGRMVIETAGNSKPAQALRDLARLLGAQKDKKARRSFSLEGVMAALKGTAKKGKGLRDSEGGASALEFALIAPLVCFALLAMVDVGLAVNERMTIDGILRQGAQAALADPGEGRLRQVLNMAGAQTPLAGELRFETVRRYCVCPDNADMQPDAAPSCTTISCPDAAAPYVFYRMEASKPYEPMSLPEILPDFELSSTVQVQVQ